MLRHVIRTLALALGALLVCASLAAPAYAAVPQAGDVASQSSDEPAPGEGEAPQGTPGTDAETSADQGVGDGTPVWIFYVLVVVVAVGGLVGATLVRRRRRG